MDTFLNILQLLPGDWGVTYCYPKINFENKITLIINIIDDRCENTRVG